MRMQVRLDIKGARPLRNGSAFWWAEILERTRDGGAFTYADLDGASEPYHEKYLGQFLRKLEEAGYIERQPTDESARTYVLVKRRSYCPVIAEDGSDSNVGKRQQAMWNVMRRRRQGFTVDELAIDASTEGAIIARNTAKQYCLLLKNAGLLVIQRVGKRGETRNVYVLKGSANTGPRPPRRMRARLVFDPNRNQVFGDVIAEEEESQ
ncbi:hypothetical protein SAMN05880590_10122 [Rhizobium sp. RU35A]|uniref:hypothetical protein n=1 Tax=Rhizobium sp. RU35A TaxID=1907414 RepID=UPI000954717A|nr:hypothetical protein [Rhizobium sp. RU35A]SIP89071.1 hypothetical protein SAMN05880590_10122 [Rhizobium sp. RU35A]